MCTTLLHDLVPLQLLMDGHLRRHLRRRNSLPGDSPPHTPRSIATGTALHTREQARRELKLSAGRVDAADPSPREESAPMRGHDEAQEPPLGAFEQSPMYVDEQQLLELQTRPPVAFVVRNEAAKDEQVQAAVATTTSTGPPRRKQSWHSPVHVPLSHRKLVQPPEIFRADPPFRPVAPRAPTGRKRDSAGAGTARMLQKPTRLTPMPTAGPQEREQLSNRCVVLVLTL